MTKYKVTYFFVRPYGSLGIGSPRSFIVDAETEYAARKAAIDAMHAEQHELAGLSGHRIEEIPS